MRGARFGFDAYHLTSMSAVKMHAALVLITYRALIQRKNCLIFLKPHVLCCVYSARMLKSFS